MSGEIHGRSETECEKQEEVPTTKVCSKCGETKSVSEFYKHKGNRDGLTYSCRDCVRAANAGWRAANKEKKAAYDAEWRAANPNYAVEWRAANPENDRACKQRRRARKRNAQGDFTSDDWKQKLEYYGYKCRYCGIHKNDTPEGWLEADHAKPLVLGGANWISNIVPACKSCNCSKGAKTFKEFMEKINDQKAI